MKYAAYIAAVVLPLHAAAASFDPDEYLRQTYTEKSEVNIANAKVVVTDENLQGIPYVKFAIGESALYVEKPGFEYFDDIPDDVFVECAIKEVTAEGEEITKVQEVNDLHRFRLDHKITNKLKLDFTFANTIIFDACSGNYAGYELEDGLAEIGVSWATTEKRQTTIHRVFFNLLSPMIGYGQRF